MKKFVLAPALAAIAMFVFGAVYWMSPLPYKALTPVSDNAAAALSLAQLFPATGTYLIPGPEIKDQALLKELYERGPSAEVQFIKEGHGMMEPAVFIKGYVHYFLVALLLAFALQMVRLSLKSHAFIVLFSGLLGLVGAALPCMSDSIWWHHPLGWHLVQGLYTVIALAVAGLVLGIFFKPTPLVAVTH